MWKAILIFIAITAAAGFASSMLPGDQRYLVVIAYYSVLDILLLLPVPRLIRDLRRDYDFSGLFKFCIYLSVMIGLVFVADSFEGDIPLITYSAKFVYIAMLLYGIYKIIAHALLALDSQDSQSVVHRHRSRMSDDSDIFDDSYIYYITKVPIYGKDAIDPAKSCNEDWR